MDDRERERERERESRERGKGILQLSDTHTMQTVSICNVYVDYVNIHTFASQSSPISAMISSKMTTTNPISRISFSTLPVIDNPPPCRGEEGGREGGREGGERGEREENRKEGVRL